MVDQRYTIRLKYGFGYQILDGNTLLETHEKRMDAIERIRCIGGRLALRWQRIDFGDGIVYPHDFTAHDGDITAGRILRHDTGPTKGRWFWSMTHTGRDVHRHRARTCSGYADDKTKAAEMVERTYTLCLGGEA